MHSVEALIHQYWLMGFGGRDEHKGNRLQKMASLVYSPCHC